MIRYLIFPFSFIADSVKLIRDKMADCFDLLDYNEEIGDSDDEKDSRETLFKPRRFVSSDETNEPVDDDSRRSRSPIRTPSFDSREPTETKESSPEPIENVTAPKTR